MSYLSAARATQHHGFVDGAAVGVTYCLPIEETNILQSSSSRNWLQWPTKLLISSPHKWRLFTPRREKKTEKKDRQKDRKTKTETE